MMRRLRQWWRLRHLSPSERDFILNWKGRYD